MRTARTIAVLLTLMLPLPALAHAPTAGIGGAYAAFTHTLTEPPAPLALLGLGLLLGLHGAETFKWTWLAFFAAMSAGVGTTVALKVFLDPEVPLVLIALVSALLAASGFALPHLAAIGLGGLAGFVFGVFIAPSPASWSTQAYTVCGGLLAANIALLYIVSAVDTIRERWPMTWITIGLRVIASWIAAISALMLALSIR